jgi:drug/metabolite transporter (DMT)-like permease
VARTTFGWLGVTLMFAAAARIPLSDATAISFLSPVFTLLLAIPLLGERVGQMRWMAALIALAGGLILTRPGTGVVQMGALIAFCAAVVMGLEVIFIKKLSGREPVLPLMLVNNALGLVISSVAVVFVWQVPMPQQWPALAALGLAMAAAQFCFVNAMARADASFAMPFFYTTLLFSALYDAAVFGVVPDAVSYAGSAVVVAGAGLLAWREARKAPPQEAPAEQGPI